MFYCASRFRTVRRLSREVRIGGVGVGGTHPLRVQSMTTSDTQDVAATVRQSIALAEVGCEIVRVTAPNVAAARCLRDIRAQLSAAGFSTVPLVADIHFLPSAAMEAVEHVEKVRVNPGNYADKKKFAVREYSDAAYAEELQRLHDAFSPLVKRCRELGRAMRIGTNHGSLSDRIMNRYGDSPLGMVESALEFLRIAANHDYHDIVLSMKASNPKVMIEAYRLLVARMAAEQMHYPLHLGVTEAGDGEDGRIKSAIGIGSLLLDGLGDTIRVSLTEDSVYEIPVARALADKAMAQWRAAAAVPADQFPLDAPDGVDPYHYKRRAIIPLELGSACTVAADQPPRVIVRAPDLAALLQLARELADPRLQDTPVEGLLVPVPDAAALVALPAAAAALPVKFLVLELGETLLPADLEAVLAAASAPIVLLWTLRPDNLVQLADWTALLRHRAARLALATTAETLALAPVMPEAGLLITLADPTDQSDEHAVGAYRRLADTLAARNHPAPLWIRTTAATALQPRPDFLSRLLEASILGGALLADGLGDLVSVETETDTLRATRLTYNVLQGAGARITKTEFVACPSCGRTLFDLQSTTQRIREKTGHLKGVKLAIMGCIVNGPGEMADADFGYVGGAPGKINLYVGKECVAYNIPQAEADARLIDLIKVHGKWIEPPAPPPVAAV
jgi:(E)-4-hydroxy-3-methylbut-2-enyl-diphosphate synthase